MINSSNQGMGEIFQGNTLIGAYPYHIQEGVEPDRKGVLYVGDRVAALAPLMGSELGLRLADGTHCHFRITNVGSKMGIKVTRAPQH